MSDDPPHVTPSDRAAWRRWLRTNHAREQEVRVVFHRKSTGRAGINYDEAVEEALCFGWIDGVKHRLDDERYTYRFTPRRAGSKWSDSNKVRVARLLEEGRMHAAGRAAVESAQRDGTWDQAARTPDPGEVPTELARLLRKDRTARKAYEASTAAQQRQWRRWVAEPKREETRERRAEAALNALREGRGDPWRK